MLQLRDHKHKSDMAKHTESVTSCPSSRVRAGQLTVSGFSVEMRLVAPRLSTRNVPCPALVSFVCTDSQLCNEVVRNYVLLPRAPRPGEVYLLLQRKDCRRRQWSPAARCGEATAHNCYAGAHAEIWSPPRWRASQRRGRWIVVKVQPRSERVALPASSAETGSMK